MGSTIANVTKSVVRAGWLQTIHWLRYGCLPVFVIEGQTPAAKLEKLRQR